jgi:hypothetical protein
MALAHAFLMTYVSALESGDSHNFNARFQHLPDDAGFEAGSQGKEPDDTKSLAWQRGWAKTHG